jgi:hypothetical protein
MHRIRMLPQQLRLCTLFCFAVMWNHLSYISLALPLFVPFLVWYWSQKRSKNTLSYPPGPKAYPLIGNLLDFPLSVPFWEGLASLSKQYGRVFAIL